MTTIRVLYSCPGCGLIKASVEVPARAPGVGLVGWVELVMELVGASHRRRSPACPSGTCDLMIPVDDGPVGGPQTPTIQ